MVRDRSAIYRPIRLNASRNCIFFLYPLPYRVFIKTRPINLRQFERCCFIIQIIAVFARISTMRKAPLPVLSKYELETTMKEKSCVNFAPPRIIDAVARMRPVTFHRFTGLI